MNILHIVSIICFALCLVMFFYLKWYIKKRTSVSTGLEEQHEEVQKLIHDINRITDRDSQLVEERIARLKSILEEADSRIALYLKEFEKRQTGETLYTSLGRGIRAALDTPNQKAQDAGRDEIEISGNALNQRSIEMDAYRAAGQNKTVQKQPKAKQETQPLLADSNETQELPAAKISKKQIRAHIDMLAGEGHPAQEIASRLGISIAEVNLALNLRKAKSN
ncbi:MAG: hypothetical protein FWC17_05470 [Treponema sp.]|nr:hypothetical protein [Treponema sp.]